MTKIEWTDRTWNPIVGCSVVSPGCTNCYAMKFAHRGLVLKYRGLTKKSKGGPVWNGQVKLDEKALLAPLSWKKPCRVFVNSMGDLFHENVPIAWIKQVFDVIKDTPHTYQILTKRAERLQEIDAAINFSNYPNAWIGVSVENNAQAQIRIDHLIETTAKVKFLSCEPLLGKFHLYLWLDHIQWVIVGGESGPGARPMRPEWVRSIYFDCQDYQVPFFFKQWGDYNEHGEKVGKKNSGRLLNGHEYNEMPS